MYQHNKTSQNEELCRSKWSAMRKTEGNMECGRIANRFWHMDIALLFGTCALHNVLGQCAPLHATTGIPAFFLCILSWTSSNKPSLSPPGPPCLLGCVLMLQFLNWHFCMEQDAQDRVISMRESTKKYCRVGLMSNKIWAQLWSDPSDSPSWFSVFLQHLGSCKPGHEAKCLCTVRPCGDIKEGNLSGSHLKQLIPQHCATLCIKSLRTGPSPSQRTWAVPCPETTEYIE